MCQGAVESLEPVKPGTRVLWRETLAQHFQNPDGTGAYIEEKKSKRWALRIAAMGSAAHGLGLRRERAVGQGQRWGSVCLGPGKAGRLFAQRTALWAFIRVSLQCTTKKKVRVELEGGGLLR